MPKDRGDVRQRMREAALELFFEKGYDGTTTAEIAARAGVTERTFFRHFPDKREVLFDGTALFDKLEAAIAQAPAELGALEVVLWAYQSAAPLFEENLRFAERGQKVVAQTPALQERQLAKRAAITHIIEKSLRRRKIDPEQASLAAVTGVAVAGHGLQAWVRDPSLPLAKRLEKAFRALKRLSTPAPSRKR